MTIHFYVRFHTQYGQLLAVTGNIEALGNGDVEKAFTLNHLNSEFWYGSIETDFPESGEIRYNYIFKNEDGFRVLEWGERSLEKAQVAGAARIQLVDTWNHAGEFENVFYTNPFRDVLLSDGDKSRTKQPKKFTHQFRVKAPLLAKNEAVCLLGNTVDTRHWDTQEPILLTKESGWWSVKLSLPREDFPLYYKYGVYNTKEQRFIRFETGDNRVLHGAVQEEAAQPAVTIAHDGFLHLPNDTWKGAGVSVPVFSLRSKNSFGTGEFTDLNLLVDWARKTGLKLIQILPVNDTIATHTWVDTYPYAAISAFALHPLYLNLETVAGKQYADVIKPLKKKQKQLNELSDLDYEAVMKLKLGVIRELYAVQKEQLLKDKDYFLFFEHNKHWLVPYAAFCCLRDRYKTSDFNKWKTHSQYSKEAIDKFVSPRARHYDEVALHYFTQYHLHLQLQEAAEYAHKHGIILKGDIPIGVYRYGCDAWMEPQLYHMELQAGAPPDDFAVRGQNWGFPTYNWDRMAEDGFEWWHRRFVQMGNYFDAFRIDHILGFFRIWSIPIDSVEGIMGHFVQAIPVSLAEFGQRGIWFDHYRYCKPCINDAILWELFGPNNDKFKPFLHGIGDGTYELKPEFATQRQVEQYFAGHESTEDNLRIRQGLYDLISNVILFEEPGSNGQQFHFRFGISSTTSYRHLDLHTQYLLNELYVDYFFRRQDDYWRKEAMKKLPALKRSTNMLICGEDLGLVPGCVPQVMTQLGILSLEIQRMPKEAYQEFFHPAKAPYLSVVTPSTHDMSTIRGWWEEDREKIQRFYNNELQQWGDAPFFCDAWINKAIVLQHLQSPAMWAIFQLQDILGTSDALRRSNPQEERINIPANPQHYWRYRMHLPLEQLIKEKEFNDDLQEQVEKSGRA
ncbi:4-alpha-glucanotransferase [Paraflavitalea sp. CAU 1676]|uniref:4-alpha-glucanotransferase n=1 Tax=Paraflavitalea sp. CAU 1676 TaxID=3032598 RepID=UPI0023DB7779|nr:4-alpha-glucanotransferase [Paraflavitalea sp. CAU 1676]MDF2192666.1 4-alpha-glucanotransferase [Paraflavitalea sp. CAU 1676]